jgi:hypothetical protein
MISKLNIIQTNKQIFEIFLTKLGKISSYLAGLKSWPIALPTSTAERLWFVIYSEMGAQRREV